MRKKQILLHDYFAKWIDVYKEGAVRQVTLNKYWSSHRHLKKIAPELKLIDVNRLEYQQILNKFADSHEKATTMDFHHQLKAMLLDAYDEGYLKRDPTRKVVVKGKQPSEKKTKYLNEFELKLLLRSLDLSNYENYDWIILLIAKTGLRFGDDDDKIRLNQRKPSKYKGLSRFGPEKNLQRINKFMKERPTFYKKLIQMKENFRFYLRCFYCITKVVILQFNSEKQDRISS